MNASKTNMRNIRTGRLACCAFVLLGASTLAQDSLDRFIQPRTPKRQATQQVQFEAVQPPPSGQARPRLRQLVTPEYRATIKQHHSQLVTSDRKITRIAVTAPDIVNFVQYSEKEVALIGLNVGSTDMTLWFENDTAPVMYEITVISGTPRASSPHAAVGEVGLKLRSVFPRSSVQLIPVADQVVVKGQAYDAAEANQIMQIVGAQFGGERKSVVNMLRVPGEFQVMLRVRIAELNRTQLRKLGVTCRDLLSRSKKTKSFGPTTAGISGVFENRDVGDMLRWLSSNGTISYLAEPTLTVLSGHSASFLSGGEYSVPTIIRDGETHTELRKYGTRLAVTPTVLDRDLIRLQIAPEFSQIDERTTVNGVPGTNVRRVDTVVELREGQTIAIGGLVSRQIQSEVNRKPSLRPKWFSRQATEADTELLIVVTPEIVRPMDPSDVPPMPNYYVAHPSDAELFVEGRSEGHPQPGYSDARQFESLAGIENRIQSSGIQYGQATPTLPLQQGLPSSVLPSDSPANGVSSQPTINQPSSGQPLFELPRSSGSPPTDLPPPPQAPGRSTSKPAHVYPDLPRPSASNNNSGRLDRTEAVRPVGYSAVTARPQPPVTFASAGHSLPTETTAKQLEKTPRSVVPIGHSTGGPVIRPVGHQRPVTELPPIGHSLPKKIGAAERASGQGQ